MDKICKVYVSQVKAMLPVFGKKEKTFIKKLRGDLSDYCEDNNVNTIEDLYNSYGNPQEIVFEYISLMKPNVISKRINTAKFTRALVIGLLILATMATSAFCIGLHHEYQVIKREEWVTTEQMVSEYN